MIRGVAVTENRKPTLAFRREWAVAMAAKKALNPTLSTPPLPHFAEIVDADGSPTPMFQQLAKLFTPPLTAAPFADRRGLPTEYALAWWKRATET